MFQFESLSEFLLMDGHGAYVWASYMITGLSLKALILFPYLKRRQLIIRLVRQQRIDSQL